MQSLPLLGGSMVDVLIVHPAASDVADKYPVFTNGPHIFVIAIELIKYRHVPVAPC